MFGVFSFLILLGQGKHWDKSLHRSKRLVVALLIGVFYSGLTEVLQDVVFVGRDGNIFDFSADIIGVLLGLVFFWQVFRKKRA